MKKRYRRLMLALAAVASIFLVRATGLDKGLIDEVLQGVVEAIGDGVQTPEEAEQKQLDSRPESTPEVPKEE